ncbi:MAG: L-serine ammonia-lyase [Cupriavidus sp.]|nr:L-serine ammonia-lyase [Cupriavidus sp.]
MISVLDLFKIGIGPSSSHTVGPMRAAKAFVDGVVADGLDLATFRIRCILYGSLAWTGKGHATDRAVMLGLAGAEPHSIMPEDAERMVATILATGRVSLPKGGSIVFDGGSDIIFDQTTRQDGHPNTLALEAVDHDGGILRHEVWHSVGGGFISRSGQLSASEGFLTQPRPFAFANAHDLLRLGRVSGLSIAKMIRANEEVLRPRHVLDAHLDQIVDVMLACIARGLATRGELPGGLRVQRRAPAIYDRILAGRGDNRPPAHEIMDVISVYAMAVNEENAAGGRVVTAPTNGAAGVIPAVLRYYLDHWSGASRDGAREFLLTAAAVGALCKMRASISGAEVGCQGEVGTASAMAAAGLAAVLGGSNAQIENAAEIAMEHHLGMTCDPIGGLVQIPCIERNAFGAVKAVNAASLSLRGDGTHKVSLDQVIDTMRRTGADMNDKSKETSQGGLAVSWVEC